MLNNTAVDLDKAVADTRQELESMPDMDKAMWAMARAGFSGLHTSFLKYAISSFQNMPVSPIKAAALFLEVVMDILDGDWVAANRHSDVAKRMFDQMYALWSLQNLAKQLKDKH